MILTGALVLVDFLRSQLNVISGQNGYVSNCFLEVTNVQEIKHCLDELLVLHAAPVIRSTRQWRHVSPSRVRLLELNVGKI